MSEAIVPQADLTSKIAEKHGYDWEKIHSEYETTKKRP